MDHTVYAEGIINEIKTMIKYDVNAGIDRSVAEYQDCALGIMKRRYQVTQKWSRYQAWPIEGRKDVMKIWQDIQPKVLSAIEKYLQDFRHRKLTRDIKATTARAAIKAAMQEAGMKHHFTGQTHRAKVSVLITNNRALTFYISYKKLHEQLPRAMESLKLIRQELEYLGSNLSVNKVYNIGEFE